MTAATTSFPIEAPIVELSFHERALRVPLVVKLAGANALIVLVAWLSSWLSHRANGGEDRLLLVLGVSLLAGLIVNAALVAIALRPIRAIEDTAARFWKGDLAARVPWSAVADRDIERLSEALNLLLETNERERIRLRALAEGVMHYEERVRVETARVLQESHAQSLAGLLYRISAAMAACENEDCRKDLEASRQIAQEAVENLRELSGRVHPRLLDDFGLIAAVRHMGRTIQKEVEGLSLEVSCEEVFTMRDVSRSDKAVLYRVTEEATRNALARGATTIQVALRATEDSVSIDVVDDGQQADSTSDATVNATLWLMRERLAFIGGSCLVRGDGHGHVRVAMRLPLGRAIIDAGLTSTVLKPHAA